MAAATRALAAAWESGASYRAPHPPRVLNVGDAVAA
eukprot:gene24691-12651_t